MGLEAALAARLRRSARRSRRSVLFRQARSVRRGVMTSDAAVVAASRRDAPRHLRLRADLAGKPVRARRWVSGSYGLS